MKTTPHQNTQERNIKDIIKAYKEKLKRSKLYIERLSNQPFNIFPRRFLTYKKYKIQPENFVSNIFKKDIG